MKNAAAVRDATLVAGLTAIAVAAFATNGAVVSEAAWIPAPAVVQAMTPMAGVDEATENAVLLPSPRFMPLKSAPVPAPRVGEAI